MTESRFLKGDVLESTRKVDQELERLLAQETPDRASVSKLWAEVAQLLALLPSDRLPSYVASPGGGFNSGAVAPPLLPATRYWRDATRTATQLAKQAGVADKEALERTHAKVEALMEALELVDFEESREFYHRNLNSLLTKYRGMYIAITGGEVVDSDSDFSELATRVYKKYGYRHFFMPKAVEERVVYIRTPRPRRRSE